MQNVLEEITERTMKTTTLTDGQELFINGLTENMETQDIRMTQYPLFYVQDKKERWVDDEDDWDIVKYISKYGEILGEGTDPYLEEWTDVDGEKWEVDRVAHVKYVYETVVDVGPFLTEAAADRHIEANKHHYNEPRTYVYSAWRNYEMQGLLQLLFALAGKEVPSHYK